MIEKLEKMIEELIAHRAEIEAAIAAAKTAYETLRGVLDKGTETDVAAPKA